MAELTDGVSTAAWLSATTDTIEEPVDCVWFEIPVEMQVIFCIKNRYKKIARTQILELNVIG